MENMDKDLDSLEKGERKFQARLQAERQRIEDEIRPLQAKKTDSIVSKILYYGGWSIAGLGGVGCIVGSGIAIANAASGTPYFDPFIGGIVGGLGGGGALGIILCYASFDYEGYLSDSEKEELRDLKELQRASKEQTSLRDLDPDSSSELTSEGSDAIPVLPFVLASVEVKKVVTTVRRDSDKDSENKGSDHTNSNNEMEEVLTY